MREVPASISKLFVELFKEEILFSDNDNVIHLRWHSTEEDPASGFEFYVEYEDGDDSIIVRMESFRRGKGGTRERFTPVEMFFDSKNEFEKATNNDVEVDEISAMTDLRSLLSGLQYVQERGAHRARVS